MAKIEMTADQLEELITKGRFTVKKEYLGGNMIGYFNILSPIEQADLTKAISEEIPRNEGEVDDDYYKRIQPEINERLNNLTYSAKTKDGKDIVLDSWTLITLDKDYMEMRARFLNMFKEGSYDDEVEYAVKDAAKNL